MERFQFDDDMMDSLSVSSECSDYSVVDRNAYDSLASPPKERMDVVKVADSTKKIQTHFSQILEDELPRADVFESLRARENIDAELDDELDSFKDLKCNEKLDSNLKHVAQTTFERLMEAKNIASSGQTTVKPVIDMLREITPVFTTVCGKSYEEFQPDMTAKEEYEKYKELLELIEESEDVQERKELEKKAFQLLDQCTKYAKADVERITNKRNIEQIEGRGANFDEIKSKVDGMIQTEAEDKKLWVEKCNADLEFLEKMKVEVLKFHAEESKTNERTRKNLKLQIQATKDEQERLQQKLREKELEQKKLEAIYDEERCAQRNATEAVEAFRELVGKQEDEVSGLKKCSETAAKVMKEMEDVSTLVMEKSIEAEKNYCDRLRRLEIASKESYHQALLNTAVDFKLKCDKLENYAKYLERETVQAEKQQKRFVKADMAIPAEEAKQKVKKYKEAMEQTKTEIQEYQSKLENLHKDIDAIVEDLKNFKITVDTFESLYESRINDMKSDTESL